MNIAENYQKIRKEIPGNVSIIVAGKGRTNEEIEEVIDAGAEDLGENYVQEAERMYESPASMPSSLTRANSGPKWLTPSSRLYSL